MTIGGYLAFIEIRVHVSQRFFERGTRSSRVRPFYRFVLMNVPYRTVDIYPPPFTSFICFFESCCAAKFFIVFIVVGFKV